MRMHHAQDNEARKMFRLIHGGSFMYNKEMADACMKAYHVDYPRVGRLWTWKDQTKMIEFLNLTKFHVAKYGLDIPYNLDRNLSKDELKKREDELTEYFLYEMRKRPVE